MIPLRIRFQRLLMIKTNCSQHFSRTIFHFPLVIIIISDSQQFKNVWNISDLLSKPKKTELSMSTPSRNRATVPQRGTVAAAAAAAAIAVHPPVRCRASTNSYRVSWHFSLFFYFQVVRRRIENRKIRKRMFDAIRRYSQVKWGFCDGKHRFQGYGISNVQN